MTNNGVSCIDLFNIWIKTFGNHALQQKWLNFLPSDLKIRQLSESEKANEIYSFKTIISQNEMNFF